MELFQANLLGKDVVVHESILVRDIAAGIELACQALETENLEELAHG